MDGEVREHHFEEMFSMMAEAPVGLCCFDDNLRFIFINGWLADLNGKSIEEHLGRSIGEVIPDVAAGVEAQLRHVLETGESVISGAVNAETPAHPGLIRSFQHHYYAIKTDPRADNKVACIVQEITKQKRADAELQKALVELDKRVDERTNELQKVNKFLAAEIAESEVAKTALRENEAYLNSIVNNIADGIITIDSSGIVKSTSSSADRMFGYEAEELIGRNVSILMPEPDRSKHDGYIHNYVDTGISKIVDIGPREVTALRKDGSTFPMELAIGKMKIDGKDLFVGATRDFSKRRDDEKILRDLSSRLISAQEDERSRIARELHDDFNQRLALFAIDLERLKESWPCTKDRFVSEVTSLSQMTKELASDVHRMSHQLHPSILENLGLIVATESFCDELSRQHDIRIDVVHHGVPRSLASDIALCLYRIVQEALNNVVKHSGAESARLEFYGSPEELVLRISDDGVGFDPESPRTRNGLGLLSMRERLRLVNGTISFTKTEPNGTRINVGIPLLRTASEIGSKVASRKTGGQSGDQTDGKIAIMANESEPEEEIL